VDFQNPKVTETKQDPEAVNLPTPLLPKEAKEIENGRHCEPALAGGIEEPKGAEEKGHFADDDANTSLIDCTAVLGPYGNTVRSDLLGQVRFVRQCTKCHAYRDDPERCGICRKQFAKNNPILKSDSLSEKQLVS
jgi:hypothetical protein